MMKTTLSLLLALAITTLPAIAQAKSLSLLSKPETTATVVALVKSGDWIKFDKKFQQRQKHLLSLKKLFDFTN